MHTARLCIILVVIFNCKDAAAELMKVASFSKANNVVFSGFVVFLSLLLM